MKHSARGGRWPALLFALVVLTLLAQVSWWTYFLFRSTGDLETAAEHLTRGESQAAAEALGADRVEDLAEVARGRRLMFVAEGITVHLLVLVGLFAFYRMLRREQRRRAEQDRLLAGTTHELKTPLASLRLGLQTIDDGRLPETRRHDYVQAMLRETARLERGVENLLGAAALGVSDSAGLRLEPGDLADDVETALAELGQRLELTDAVLDRDLQPAPVQRDPRALRLALLNLLENAIKYGDGERGARIRIETRVAGDRAELRIHDHGLGMTPEEIEAAFERFYRGPGKEHLGGSGLGLYLVRELVVAQGGSITAHSDGPGTGSEFVLRLPLANGTAEVTS